MYDIRSGEEDRQSSDDEVDGEDPEAQPVDDHRRKLPVVRLFGVLAVVLHLLGHEPQLTEYRRKLAAAGATRTPSPSAA